MTLKPHNWYKITRSYFIPVMRLKRSLYYLRNSRRKILPTVDFGNCSIKTIDLGTL